MKKVHGSGYPLAGVTVHGLNAESYNENGIYI